MFYVGGQKVLGVIDDGGNDVIHSGHIGLHSDNEWRGVEARVRGCVGASMSTHQNDSLETSPLVQSTTKLKSFNETPNVGDRPTGFRNKSSTTHNFFFFSSEQKAPMRWGINTDPST